MSSCYQEFALHRLGQSVPPPGPCLCVSQEGRRGPAQPSPARGCGEREQAQTRRGHGVAGRLLSTSAVGADAYQAAAGTEGRPPRAPPLTRAPQAPALPATPGRGAVQGRAAHRWARV